MESKHEKKEGKKEGKQTSREQAKRPRNTLASRLDTTNSRGLTAGFLATYGQETQFLFIFGGEYMTLLGFLEKRGGGGGLGTGRACCCI